MTVLNNIKQQIDNRMAQNLVSDDPEVVAIAKA